MPLSLSPLQEHCSGRNRGWEAYTIFTKDSVCSVWQSVCMRACVNSVCVDNIVLHFLTVVTADSLEANGGFETRWAPFADLTTRIHGQGAADWPFTEHFRCITPQCVKQFLRVSLVCLHICVCLWVNKNHCLVSGNTPLPHLSAEESVAPGSYRQTLCRLLIYEFVQYDNNNTSLSVEGLWCVCSFFFRFLCTFVFRCLWNSSQIKQGIYLNSDFVLNTKVFSYSCTRLHLWIHHSMLEVIKNYNWLRNRQCINKTESNKGLGIMKLSPKDMFMHAEKKSTTADIKRQTPTTKTCPCSMWHSDIHIRCGWGCISLCFDHPGTRSQPRCLLGYQGISTDFPHIVPPGLPLRFLCCPPGGKGGKIRLQSTSKIVLTQTHFLMLHEGGWQAR